MCRALVSGPRATEQRRFRAPGSEPRGLTWLVAMPGFTAAHTGACQHADHAGRRDLTGFIVAGIGHVDVTVRIDCHAVQPE